MSMSTSGVPRPSPLSRIAKKATAAAGDAPDDAETEVDLTPTDKAPARAAGRATGAKPAGGGAAKPGAGAGGGAAKPGASATSGAATGAARPAPGSGAGAAKPAASAGASAAEPAASAGVSAAKPAASAAKTARPAAKTAPAKAAKATANATKVTPKVIDVDLDVDDDDEQSDEVVAPVQKAAPKPAAKTPTKVAGRPGGKGPAGRGPVRGGGGKGKRPTGRPVRVAQGRNWTSIGLYITAGALALAIVGFGVYALVSRPDPTKWKERADAIPGIVDYRNQNPAWLNSRNHVQGVQTYPVDPPVGGNHNPNWQNCMGNVYTRQIAKEHAVHSLEHGAVWIAYQPDLPKDQVDKLASMVRDVPFTFMAPYPGLDKPISLQAWGFQLKVDNANDSRIPDFINDLRQSATMEPQAGCSGGVTEQGISTPLNLGG